MSGTGSDELLDPGAQAERTAFAWQRTGLSTIAVGALLVDAHSRAGALPPWPGIVLMAAGAGLAALVAPLRYVRVLRAVGTGTNPVSGGIVPATALVVLVVVTAVAVALGAG